MTSVLCLVQAMPAYFVAGLAAAPGRSPTSPINRRA